MNLVCDGGCKSNGNNPTLMMWRVYDSDKKKLVVDKSTTKIVENGRTLELTNNKAELCAFVEAARIASRGSRIGTDSKIVLFWIKNGLTGKSKAKDQEFIIRGISAARELITKKQLKVYWFNEKINPADCK